MIAETTARVAGPSTEAAAAGPRPGIFISAVIATSREISVAVEATVTRKVSQNSPIALKRFPRLRSVHDHAHMIRTLRGRDRTE